MRRRRPDWRVDVERERQRRVERGLPPTIEDVTVLTAIAEVIRLSRIRRREQAERAQARRRRATK